MDMVGKSFKNTKEQYFSVEQFLYNNSKNRYYNIKFTKTGYTAIVTKSQIKRGNIKDRFEPSVANTGYLGSAKSNRKDKIYSVWHNMINRCYNSNSTEYKHYGALGVTVDDEWKCFEYFREDLHKVENWNEDGFYKGLIFLDKDKKQISLPIGDRVYSLKTCNFISAKENNYYNNTHYWFKATSPSGYQIIDYNLADFCEKNDINKKLSYNTINNYQHSTNNGWKLEKV